ncbi:MAG: hypothetical protein H6719_08050 [Sandaracinaceae bacterium]|nr:hypothetical protein [Sandaracinaceae bacterium]
MQIHIRIQVGGCDAEAPMALRERLRSAMGSYTAEVHRVSLALRSSESGVSGTGSVRLRDHGDLEVRTEALTLAEAGERLCHRVASSVARRVDTERMLGS